MSHSFLSFFPAALLACGLLGSASSRAQDAAPAQAPADIREHLATQLERGTSPRDWALATQLLEARPPTGAHLRQRLVLLRKAAQAAPGDRLVQAMWSSLVSSQPCRGRSGCGDRGGIARLDPGNAATWVPVLDGAWKSGRTRVVDDVLVQMAASGRYNEHFGQAVGAWLDVLARHPPGAGPGQEGAALQLVLDEARATAIPDPTALVDACSKARHPETAQRRFTLCGRVGRLLMDRAQTVAGRMAGVAVLRASREGTKDDIERIRTVTWQAERMEAVSARLDADPVELQNYLNLIQINGSQMAAVQYELAIHGIATTPPEGWTQTVDGHPVEPLDDRAAP